MKRGNKTKQFFLIASLSLVLLSGGCGDDDPIAPIGGGSGGGGGGGTTKTCQQRGGVTLPGNICKFSQIVFAMYNDQYLGGTYMPILFPGNPGAVGVALDIGQGKIGNQVVYTGDMEWGELDIFQGCDENPSLNAEFLVTDGADVYPLVQGQRIPMQADGRIYIGFNGDQQNNHDCIESRGTSLVSLIKCETLAGASTPCP